jgi:uncharacterized Zn-binding protein involved in type VI secretion
MQKARLGDQISHGGSIVSASTDVLDNGIGVARLGDAVICDRHGSQVIVTCSPNILTDGIGTARLGDFISCGATIVSGSPDTLIN